MKKATKNLIFYGTFAALILITVYMYVGYNYDGFVGAGSTSGSKIDPKKYPGGMLKGARFQTNPATMYAFMDAYWTAIRQRHGEVNPPFIVKIYDCKGTLFFDSTPYPNQGDGFDAFYKKQDLKSAANKKYGVYTIFLTAPSIGMVEGSPIPAGTDLVKMWKDFVSSRNSFPDNMKKIARDASPISLVFDNYEYPANRLNCKMPTS